MVFLRTKPTMKSFKGQQQLESHLEAQGQPAHLVEQRWDMLRRKSAAYQAGSHWLAFQITSKGSLEWGLLLNSGVAEEELYCVSHPRLPGPANACESLLFGLAAN